MQIYRLLLHLIVIILIGVETPRIGIYKSLHSVLLREKADQEKFHRFADALEMFCKKSGLQISLKKGSGSGVFL